MLTSTRCSQARLVVAHAHEVVGRVCCLSRAGRCKRARSSCSRPLTWTRLAKRCVLLLVDRSTPAAAAAMTLAMLDRVVKLNPITPAHSVRALQAYARLGELAISTQDFETGLKYYDQVRLAEHCSSGCFPPPTIFPCPPLPYAPSHLLMLWLPAGNCLCHCSARGADATAAEGGLPSPTAHAQGLS